MSVSFPVIISSINPTIERTVIAGTMTEETKDNIVQQLEEQCTIRTIATDLAVQAKQETKRQKFPRNIRNSVDYSATKPHSAFPHPGHGTTPSNSNQEHQTQ